ncbi:MAG: hypothetical protein ACK2UJ_00960 [Candidatus Promineifilaceae bacterium]
MSKNPDKRKCSAVRGDGQPCQAWAMCASDPPLCPAHAGVQKGKGAPKGNRNALKHGMYLSILRPDEVRDLEMVKSTSLMHELVLMRVALRRVAGYLNEDGLPLEQVLAIAPVMSTMVRTLVRLLDRIDDVGFDWDEVLDELNKEWKIEV